MTSYRSGSAVGAPKPLGGATMEVVIETDSVPRRAKLELEGKPHLAAK